VLEVVVLVVEGNGYALQVALEIGHLLLEGVEFAFGLGAVADL
jgi:hypothetical protein